MYGIIPVPAARNDCTGISLSSSSEKGASGCGVAAGAGEGGCRSADRCQSHEDGWGHNYSHAMMCVLSSSVCSFGLQSIVHQVRYYIWRLCVV